MTAQRRKRKRARNGSPKPDEHKGVQVKFYADPDELREWKRIAAEQGRTLSGWLRWMANSERARSVPRRRDRDEDEQGGD